MQIKSLVISGATVAVAAGLFAGVAYASASPASAPAEKPAPSATIDPTVSSERAAADAPEAYYDRLRSFAPFANQSDINLNGISHAVCGGLAALGYTEYSADLQRLGLSKFQTLQVISLVVPQFCPAEESAVTG